VTLLDVPMKSARRGSHHNFPSAFVKKHKAVEPVVARVPFEPVEIFSYEDLIEALRLRVDNLGISRETIDEISGITPGLASKILSLRHVRRVGLISMAPLLETLGLKLVALPNDEALARVRSRYTPRDVPHTRSATAGHDPRNRLLRWCESRGITVSLVGKDGSEKILVAKRSKRKPKRRRRSAG
jgi:hypothetical protein